MCVLRRGMLKGMLTPCVRIASDPPCFYCSLPSAWKGGLCPIWVPGLWYRVCLGYALGMLSCVDTVIHFVGQGHSPFHRPRSVPPNHTPKRGRKTSIVCFLDVVWGMCFSCNLYACSIDRVCLFQFARNICSLLRF